MRGPRGHRHPVATWPRAAADADDDIPRDPLQVVDRAEPAQSSSQVAEMPIHVAALLAAARKQSMLAAALATGGPSKALAPVVQGDCVIVAHFDPTGLTAVDAAVVDHLIHAGAGFLLGDTTDTDRAVVAASNAFARACGCGARGRAMRVLVRVVQYYSTIRSRKRSHRVASRRPAPAP